MFLAHSFRLRDPWKCEQLKDSAVRWTRIFHRPTGMEPDDQLFLVISGLPPDAQVTINGKPFAPAERAAGFTPTVPPQFNLTQILADSNQIELLIPPLTASSLQPPASSFPYDARLAILAQT
jgi:hypothetical protein